MVPFALRRSSRFAVRMLALAAVAGPQASFAQLELRSDAEDVPAGIAQTIEEMRAENGFNAPELVDPFTALALYYQEYGDHELAIAAIEQARQVVRVNYGLFSLEEAPLLRQQILSERERGNVEAAWDVEQRLLNLVRRHPDDLRTVPILREIGDHRFDVLRRYVSGEFPPEIVLGCYYSQGWGRDRNCRAGSRGRAKTSLLREAVSYYADAITTIFRTQGYASDQLPELLTKLVGVGYEYGWPTLGRTSLRHLLAYAVENSASPLAQTNALVNIADWDLLFADGYRGTVDSVRDVYARAYAQLESAGVEQQSIDAIFSPTIPVVLPTFLPNPLSSAETPETVGFIDVAFVIKEDGTSEHVEILDTTTNATDDAMDRLVDVIEGSKFRPRTANGRFEETSSVVVRYYLDE